MPLQRIGNSISANYFSVFAISGNNISSTKYSFCINYCWGRHWKYLNIYVSKVYQGTLLPHSMEIMDFEWDSCHFLLLMKKGYKNYIQKSSLHLNIHIPPWHFVNKHLQINNRGGLYHIIQNQTLLQLHVCRLILLKVSASSMGSHHVKYW